MLSNTLILIPLLMSAMVWLLPEHLLKKVSTVVSFFLLGVAAVAYAYFGKTGNLSLFQSDMSWISSLGARWSLNMDGLGLVMAMMITLVLPVVLLSVREPAERNRPFYALLWMMAGAVMGSFLASDGLLFYTFWELSLIPAYFLSLLWGKENTIRITFKFFIYTLAGSLLMLGAFIYIYIQGPGSWNIQSLYETARTLSYTEQQFIFWLIFLAFAIKMPVFPFHTWQPDTYHNAPTPVTIMLSSLMSKMGVYGVLRWLIPMVPAASQGNAMIIVSLAVLSVLYASVIALIQEDFKRMIAWSSIAHLGLMCAGIFSLDADGLKGAIFQMLSHGIIVAGLFYIGEMLYARLDSHFISAGGGIKAATPKLAAFFLIVVMASISLPLTNGFIGEFLLLKGIFAFEPWLALAGGGTVVLGATYMLRTYQTIMLGPEKSAQSTINDLSGSEQSILTGIAILIVLFGLFPHLVIDLISSDIDVFITQTISTLK